MTDPTHGPSIEVVVINYKRPQNLPLIVQAFKSQSLPCFVTVLDCASPQFQLPLTCADRVVPISYDRGPYDRYMPLHLYQSEFIHFHDDDMLPGRRSLEHLLETYRQVENPGVIGQFGKVHPVPKKPYTKHRCYKIRQSNVPIECDMIARSYFLETKNLSYLKYIEGKLDSKITSEDDITLCCCLSLYGGLRHYVVPYPDDPEKLSCVQELDDAYALSLRPIHEERRTKCLREFYRLGWKRQTNHCNIPLL